MNLRLMAIAVFSFALFAGCRSSEETKETFGAERTSSRKLEPEVGFVNLRLAPQQLHVATVQFYRGNQETSLPVLATRSFEGLTLEFDLMQRDGRPLRVEFQRADRMWQDDFLNPTLFMDRQSGDDITHYRESTAPSSTYVHYEYRFPNDVIGFKLSGNYVLTVLDPSLDDRVLFERPFVVTEESAEVAFELRGVPVPGAIGVWNQPHLLFDQRPFSESDIFDFAACFVKNTRFDLGRCGSRPSLFEAPFISFDLDPQASFEPEPDLHLLDISELRSGIGIEEIFFDVEPHEVNLVPDLADMGSPEPGFQNGQSAVRAFVRDLTYPEYQSEYVLTHFTYIPFREQRASGPLLIVGSFGGWVIDERNVLTWIEEEKRYRGAILLKQGRHAYQYYVSGSRPPSQGTFAPESSYTALLYYFDPVLHTDRLVAVRSVIAP
jgi:hypothetical protein